MSYLLRALIIFKATRLSLNLTRIEAGASVSGFGVVHARALCIWPTWGFRSQRNHSRLGLVSTSGDLKSMVPCVLCHLLGPGTFKLMSSLCKCQVFWVAEEKVSKMHMENVVGQTLPPFSTGFKETWVQSELTCPGHLVHGERLRTEIWSLRTESLLFSMQEVRGLNSVMFKVTSSLCSPPTAHLPTTGLGKKSFPPRCPCHCFRAHLHVPLSVLRPPLFGSLWG